MVADRFIRQAKIGLTDAEGNAIESEEAVVLVPFHIIRAHRVML